MKNVNLYNNTGINYKQIIEVDLSECKNDNDIFNVFKSALKFPEWFGENWNSFHDCMANLCFEIKDILVVKVLGLKNIYSISKHSANCVLEELIELDNGKSTQDNGERVNAIVYLEYCEEIIKALYSRNDSLSGEQKDAFGKFAIDLFETFPDFRYDGEVELAYILAGEFVDYMASLIGVDEKELDKALRFIEKLQNDKRQCIKELATIGFVEAIQNSWNEENKKTIYPKLGKKTKKAWNELNKFWAGK